jgi:hypothetical protein
MIAVAASQLLVGLLIDRVDPWYLIAGCGAITLAYSIGWRLVTRRMAPGEPAADAT